MVKVVSTKRASNIIASYSSDLITYSYLYNLENVRRVIVSSNAFTIGNGMGRSKEILEFIRKIIESTKIPKVIDADGIYSVSKMKLKNSVIAPHKKEFEILTGENLTGTLKKDCDIVLRNAKKKLIVLYIVTKGHVDIIYDEREVFVNKTGNPYMTKSGTGDILMRIIGSLIAQGNSLLESACVGAYICGKAGDLTVKKKGPGLLSTDIIEKIPEV